MTRTIDQETPDEPTCPDCGNRLEVLVELRVSARPLSIDPLTLDLDEVTTNGLWDFEVNCDECEWEQRLNDDEVEWL